LRLCPADHEAGRFKDRSPSSVKNYWFDYVQPEANKIQSSLSKVLAKKPTGNLSELQKINIAVALHLGKIEKFNYDYKDFDSATHWKCFSAWYEVLRKEPKWARDLSSQPLAATPVQLAQRLAAVNSTGTALDQSLAAPAGTGVATDNGDPPIVPPVAPPVPPPAPPANIHLEAPAAAARAVEDAANAAGVATSESEEIDSVSAVLAETAALGGVAAFAGNAASAGTAITDFTAVSARKREIGRGRAKAAVKKSKQEDKKTELMEKKQKQMTEWIGHWKAHAEASKKQASTTHKLEGILKKQQKLNSKKEKKSDVRFLIKLAKHKGDKQLLDRAMNKMTKMCSEALLDSSSESDASSSEEEDIYGPPASSLKTPHRSDSEDGDDESPPTGSTISS
jgi:hypothetical protein